MCNSGKYFWCNNSVLGKRKYTVTHCLPMETGKSVNICLLKYSQRVMSSLNMGKKWAKPMCGERFSRTWTFFLFFGRIAPHTLPPMPLPEIKVLRKIIPFQLGKGHFDGEVLDVKEGHFHCSFCSLRNGSVPFNPTHTQWNHSWEQSQETLISRNSAHSSTRAWQQTRQAIT